MTTQPRSRPTIHDVAALAGVSKSLVSLAMRDSPKVASESRTAIIAAAAKLGYRPNAAARSLADRHSRTVGVLATDLHNPIFAQILDGVQEQLRSVDYATMLVSGGTDPALEIRDLDKLLEFQVEGLILISHRLPPAKIRALAAELPTVVVSRRDVVAPCLDTVSNDDLVGARLAVQHLVSLGHRRITHLDGGDNPVSAERCRGYLEAMTSAGLAQHVTVEPGGLTDAAGHAAAHRALAGTPPPSALFVANDFAALGAIAAVQERGLTVPGDVSVIGYDGMALGALHTLNLTTVAQPLTKMGALAAQRLFERIGKPGRRARHLRLDARLVIRGSTGPAPGWRTLQSPSTPSWSTDQTHQ